MAFAKDPVMHLVSNTTILLQHNYTYVVKVLQHDYTIIFLYIISSFEFYISEYVELVEFTLKNNLLASYCIIMVANPSCLCI